MLSQGENKLDSFTHYVSELGKIIQDNHGPATDKLNDFNHILRAALDDLKEIAQQDLLQSAEKQISVLNHYFEQYALFMHKELAGKRTVQRVQEYETLLQHQFKFMEVLLRSISREAFLAFRPRIHTEPYNDVNEMVKAIHQLLNNKCRSLASLSEVDLSKENQQSNRVSINSAVFTSAASFERQFVKKADNISLEDIRQLMFKNVEQYHKRLVNTKTSSELSKKQGLLVKAIETFIPTTQHDQMPPNIITLESAAQQMTLHYTIPLAYHAMDVQIQLNEETGTVDYHIQFFGEPRDRLHLMEVFSLHILRLIASDILVAPSINNEAWQFELQFKQDLDSSELLENAIRFIQMLARLSFNDRKVDASVLIDAARKAKVSDEVASLQLKLLLKTFFHNKSQHLSEDDIRRLIAFTQERRLPDSDLKYFSEIISTKTRFQYLSNAEFLREFIEFFKAQKGNEYLNGLLALKLGRYDFLECMIKLKQHTVVDEILSIKTLDPTSNRTYVQMAATNNDWELVEKLLSNNFYAKLTLDQQQSLAKHNQMALDKYRTLEAANPETEKKDTKQRRRFFKNHL